MMQFTSRGEPAWAAARWAKKPGRVRPRVVSAPACRKSRRVKPSQKAAPRPALSCNIARFPHVQDGRQVAIGVAGARMSTLTVPRSGCNEKNATLSRGSGSVTPFGGFPMKTGLLAASLLLGAVAPAAAQGGKDEKLPPAVDKL